MSNLDDFFKKRDKKKKTAKSKFSTLDTEELVKNLEASTTKAEDDLEFGQENGERAANAAGNDNILDEEWRPFESDENKDYSGLRISIQNWKVEDENNENSSAIEESDKKPSCPWAASINAQQKNDDSNNRRDVFEAKQGALSDSTNQKPSSLAEAVKAGISSEEQTDTNPTDSKTSTTTTASAATGAAPAAASSYVPPHLRRQQPTTPASSQSAAVDQKPFSVSTSRKPNKSQPNINDTLEFPTLDAAVSDSTEKAFSETSDRFDFPKKASRPDTKSSGKNVIDLQNKFNALSTNN